MCGIAGIIAFDASVKESELAELRQASARMQSRGPDASGEWLSDKRNVAFSHRRLAILDLDPRGNQPMQDESGEVSISYNGEVYNFRELREQLEDSGHEFKTETDTEVLLALYLRYGEDFIGYLEGMYAIAIYNSKSGELLLARDPFGIKPLYVARSAGRFYFASQVKALLAFSEVDREIEPRARYGFFLMGSVPEPYTLFQGIKQLAPGETLKISADGTEKRGQRSLLKLFRAAPSSSSTLSSALLKSVERQLFSDAPAGLFLSAGIDSNLLLSIASRVSEQPLSTVTLGFDYLRNTPLDETELAEKSAKHFGSKHQTIWIGKEDFKDSLEHFWEAMDQPTIDGLNSYFVSLAANRAGLKVALSGLGADEIFAGYPSFKDIPRLAYLRAFSLVPGLGAFTRVVLKPFISNLTSPKYAGVLEYAKSTLHAYVLRRALFMPWELTKKIGSQKVFEEIFNEMKSLFEEASNLPISQQVSFLELNFYMKNQLLRDTDWASMSHSLEVRVPFLDSGVLKGAFSQNRIEPLTKQKMLSEISSDLPEEITKRPKTGFTVPVRDWLAELRPEYGQQRGLRSWSYVVYREYLASCGVSEDLELSEQ